MSVIYDCDVFFTNGTKTTVRKVTEVKIIASDQPTGRPSDELLLVCYRSSETAQADTVVAKFRWEQVDGYYVY